MAVNPTTNRVYVAESNSSALAVIDGDSESVVATVAVGFAPFSVAVNPTTNRVYVVDPTGGSGTLGPVVDAANNALITTVDVRLTRTYIIVNPTTNRVYVGRLVDAPVVIVDGATSTIVGRVGVSGGSGAAAVNPTTNKVYFGNARGVSVFQDSTDTTPPSTSISLNPTNPPRPERLVFGTRDRTRECHRRRSCAIGAGDTLCA